MQAYEWIGLSIAVAALPTAIPAFLRWRKPAATKDLKACLTTVMYRTTNQADCATKAQVDAYMDTGFNFRPAPRPEARFSLDATGFQKLPRVIVYTGDDDPTIPMNLPKWIRDHTTAIPEETK